MSGRQIQSIGLKLVKPWWTLLWPYDQSRYMFRDGSMAAVPRISDQRWLSKRAPWAASWAHTNRNATAAPASRPKASWTTGWWNANTPASAARYRARSNASDPSALAAERS